MTDRPRTDLRPARASSNPEANTRGKTPNLNALKHGLRSRTTLLPGDDPADLRARRVEAHTLHRPRTGAERRCVEAMVRLEWKIERYEHWQDIYDAKHDAVLGGDGHGSDGPHCEADPHRWIHRAMDCMVQTQRMERHMARVQRRLELLQKLRRQNLLARMAALEELEEDAPALSDEDIVQETEAAAAKDGEETQREAEVGQPAQDADAAIDSGDGGNGNYSKRNAPAPWLAPQGEAPPGTAAPA